MRVIGGRYRGLCLAEFSGRDVRPTADRVKESLFNILMFRVAGARVLDLFCGSGNLGIECLSRGAEYVHFNDISEASLAILRSNLKKLKGEADYKITRADYAACLAAADGKFDIIFIDPPYADDCGAAAVKIIGERGLLSAGGTVVYERDRAFSGDSGGLTLYDERKYGKTYLSFFAAQGESK